MTAKPTKKPKKIVRILEDPVRQQMFVEAYLTNGHVGYLAAQAAGYAGTYGSVAAASTRMLKHPAVQALMAARGKELAGTMLAQVTRDDSVLRLTGDNWAREVGALAFSRVGELYREDGTLIPVHELPDHVQAAIASVEVDSGKDGTRTTKIKTWNKNAALDSVARHLGLFERDNQQQQSNVRVVIELVG